jgi:hypothetical protein
MAIKINTPITTDEGFTVDNAFGYLNIYILAPNSNWVNLNYYKSEEDFVAGKAPLNVSAIPSQVQTELTNSEFWGTALATVITEKCVIAIEAVTGSGTVEIIKS